MNIYHWVFGGTERITGSSFLVEVDKRDAQTLMPIIEQYIRPGSIIYSDEWKAYAGISKVNNYEHRTVNHSKFFVNPLTGAHTQQIESLWSQMKRMMREERTMNSQLFESYLPEFMWRKKFHSKPFSHFLSCIKEQYKF